MSRRHLARTSRALRGCLAATLLVGTPAIALAEAALSPEDQQRFALRKELFQEYPHILPAMNHSPNAGFGGDSSHAIANHMYSRTNAAAIADARAKMKVEAHGKGTWLLRLPYVNIAVFETAEGLVLVDSGYAPAGPALVDTLRTLSKKPVHTIIFTHHHADHAFGAWALLEAGEKPRIVATENFLHELGLDVKLANHANVFLNNQDPADVPRRMEDVILPTDTFRGQTTLRIGGEDFVLTQARGETEDHLWVSVPGRKVVVSADYHQPFLLNTGNGKRRQRHALEWAGALRAMAATQPNIVLPMHGPAITGQANVQEKLGVVATMLETIERQVVAGLNSGKRADEITSTVKLPPEIAGRTDMEPYYNRPEDVAKMITREYSGWWNGLPSHWTPAPRAREAQELITLAGGLPRLLARAEQLMQTDPALACHLADWALLAAPEDPAALRLGLKAYANRIQPGVPAQEINVYFQHMAELKRRLKQVEAR